MVSLDSRQSRGHVNILVLSAIPAEAEQGLDVLQTLLRTRQLGVPELTLKYAELGIGPLASLSAAQGLPSADLMIYLGSCGEFSHPLHNHKPLNVRLCTARTFYWSPTASRTAAGRLITSTPLRHQLSNLHPCMDHLECLPNFTSPTLTLDPTMIPRELGSPPQRGTENMELFTLVPHLASAANVILILGITNLVGSRGHEDWQRHQAKVAAMSAEFLRNHLTKW